MQFILILEKLLIADHLCGYVYNHISFYFQNSDEDLRSNLVTLVPCDGVDYDEAAKADINDLPELYPSENNAEHAV